MTQVRCVQSKIIDSWKVRLGYINDYEKYKKEAFYLLNYLSEINFD